MSAHARISLCAATFATFGIWTGATLAQAPSIAALSPQAVRPGESTDVTLTGGNLAGVSDFWASFPCEKLLAPEIADNGKQADRVVYRLTVPADAPVGVHGIRIAGPGGVSNLALLLVDDLPSVAQQADNSTPAVAQSLTLPTAVDGVVASLGRHYFKFEVGSGQRLSFEVVSRRMGSPLDPIIRLLDATGRELTYSDDEPGLSADSRICHTFESAGEYMLELRDIRYQGGRFRLRIGDFPGVSVPYPMSVKRGSEATVSFAGPSADDVDAVTVATPADPLVDWINVGARRVNGQSSGFAILSVSDREEFVEAEPNDTAEQANRVTLGANINGRFLQPRDVDRFVLAAKKDQKLTFTAVTRQQGSSADLYLQLLNAEGAKVAEADDNGTLDAALTYTFPADGDYTLVVEDLLRRGGSEFAYHIETSPADPGFSLSATADSLNIPAGGTVQVTLNAVRRDYNGPIEVVALNLPDGATSVPTVIGPGRTSVVLTVTGKPDAATGRHHALRIAGRATIGERTVEETADVSEALKAQYSGMPWSPRPLETALAAGIGPKPPFTLRTEPSAIVYGRKLNTKVKVIVERGEGFDQAINLAVTPEKEGLPGEVSIALQPIPQGQNEVELTFAASEKAPLGTFTAVLTGTHSKDNQNVVQVAPGIRFEVRDPTLSATVEKTDGVLKRGGELRLKVSIVRDPVLSAPVTLSLVNPPQGITAENVVIPVEGNSGELILKAAADAAAGKAEKLGLFAAANVGEAAFTATVPLDITVE